MIGLMALAELKILSFGVLLILVVFPSWKICEKAGFPGWYSLAVFFPMLNVFLLYYLAFASWPALEDAELDRSRTDDP